MWSGPRNISTALMRSWGSRADTFVCDEPFYAHYLLRTGAPHPGREEVIASQENDWRRVAEWLTGEIPEGKRIFYQKQMTHHLLAEMGREWIENVSNAFLIREPRGMLVSLLRVTPGAGVADTGLPQQWELFERVRGSTGRVPPVIDCRDVLENPEGILKRLCEALGVPFDPAMLSWEPGRRPTDGVWAKHWYASVERSTGFHRHVRSDETVPASHAGVYQECLGYYERLHAHRIVA